MSEDHINDPLPSAEEFPAPDGPKSSFLSQLRYALWTMLLFMAFFAVGAVGFSTGVKQTEERFAPQMALLTVECSAQRDRATAALADLERERTAADETRDQFIAARTTIREYNAKFDVYERILTTKEGIDRELMDKLATLRDDVLAATAYAAQKEAENAYLRKRTDSFKDRSEYLNTLLRSALGNESPTVRQWAIEQIGKLVVRDVPADPDAVLTPLTRDLNRATRETARWMLAEYRTRPWHHLEDRPKGGMRTADPHSGPASLAAERMEKDLFLESLRQ